MSPLVIITLILSTYPLYKPYKLEPPQRVGFWAFLVWKRVYTLPILVWNRLQFSRELGVAYERSYRFDSKWIRTK